MGLHGDFIHSRHFPIFHTARVGPLVDGGPYFAVGLAQVFHVCSATCEQIGECEQIKKIPHDFLQEKNRRSC